MIESTIRISAAEPLREVIHLLRPFWSLVLFATTFGILSGLATAWLLATINIGLHTEAGITWLLLLRFAALCLLSVAGTAIAGIGNLYASEILHVAGIHPAARCYRLRTKLWEQLHAAIHAVLEDAIRYEGSTLSDGTYRNALNESGGYQNHHRVYDRAGQTCPTCHRVVITRIVQTQRSTFFCPVCQK